MSRATSEGSGLTHLTSAPNMAITIYYVNTLHVLLGLDIRLEDVREQYPLEHGSFARVHADQTSSFLTASPSFSLT